MEENYIIDFDRVNQLTSHPNDTINTSGGYGQPFIYSVSRKIIKSYLDIYLGEGNKAFTNSEWDQIIDTLHFNKILVSKSDIRDGKIEKILQ